MFQFGKAQNSKLNIRVDEKMELITIVQYLSNNPLMTKADIDYKSEVDTYFQKFKNHSIVKLNSKIQNEYFSGSCVPWYLFQFDFPNFRLVSKFTEDEIQIEDFEKHRDTLNLYVKELKNFYYETNFKTFFKNHKKFYDEIVLPVKNYISQFDIIKMLENHYGENKNSYNIILSPLMHDGGFASWTNTKKGQNIFAFIGPKFNSLKVPVFNIEEILQQYIIHEFSHTFCNPIINKNLDNLIKYECLENKISSHMIKQGYGDDWVTCLYEHLVRANEIVLVKKIFGIEESDKLFHLYSDNKNWIYLKGIVPIIENDFLNNREKYKTQYDIIDKIVIYLNEEKSIYCN